MNFAATQESASGKKPVKTTNLAGGSAFKQDTKTELVSAVLTTFLAGSYYDTADTRMKRISELADTVAGTGADGQRFLCKLALYTRNRFHLRSVTHLLGAHIALLVDSHNVPEKRAFFKALAERPDDIVQTLSAYKSLYKGQPIPSALKRGFADKLTELSAYQLGKYKGGKGNLSLIDAVNICHPKGNEQLSALMNGTLESPETWEVLLSAAGSDPEKKSQVWADLVNEDKLGYMAALRNLRNISKQSDEATLDKVLNVIADPERVAKSKQLPFRFWSAYKVAQNEGLPRKVITALDTALDHAVANCPVLPGKTLVAVDFSGSMSASVNGRKDGTTCREIATLLGVICGRRMEADFCYFGDDTKFHGIHPTNSVMGQMEIISGFNQNYRRPHGQSADNTHVGHGTSIASILNRADKAYDRILIFSDMQAWSGSVAGSLSNYIRHFDAKPYIYSVDLRGHGTSPFNTGNSKLFQLAGFSDKIFDLIGASEQGTDAMLTAIEDVQL